MSLLIKNVNILTFDKKQTDTTSICIKDGHIFSIGEIPPDFTPKETIDGTGKVIIPAFFNCHAHASMTLVRGWAEDLPFDRWLNEKIWVVESALCEEDIYWGASLACCEMIRSGMVGFGEDYFWANQVAKAVAQSGMKSAVAWCLFGENEIGKITMKDVRAFIKEWHNTHDGRIKCFLGPHSPYMCSPDFLKEIAMIAGEFNVGIHIHLSESEEQVQTSLKKYGKTPVAHLNELGIFDHRCIAAHCISVDDEDISILAEKGVYVAHTPKTYMKLALGIAPVDKFLKAGVKVGLGTDGPASNNDLNMLEIMRLTGLIQKNHLIKPEVLPNNVLLDLATRGSAMALGFEDSGIIKVGASADLIIFNTGKPHMIPKHNIAANIVYSSHPSDIDYVICDGKVLLSKGELKTIDEEHILYEAEKRAYRITGSSMEPMWNYKG
jgi:5-methylthioadenosine/S-adenosylhomocysteine deaminase